MPKLTPTEKQIVKVLSNHIAQNDEVSLTELAEECHVAKSTVVKAIKKIGYQGFGDLSYSARFNANTCGGLLPGSITTGDVEADAKILAEIFFKGRNAHNLIFSGDRRTSVPLATYMSRKLSMFEVFATPSYDYEMAIRSSAQDASSAQGGYKRFVIFFFHKEPLSRKGSGQQEGFGENMFHAAKRSGFNIIVFSDDSRPLQDEADYVIQIAPNEGLNIDLFLPRVLIVFERALSQFSKRVVEE